MKSAWIVGWVCLASANLATAQRGRASAEVQAAIEQLGSADPMEVRGALETLGVLGQPAAVRPIADRIQRGLPPELLDAALDALTVLGRPDAAPVLFELCRHRRASVRVKAVQAIVATRPRGGDRALIDALSDADASVRGAAAEGLGTIGATGGLDALFHALDRRVPQAAVAIGQLARANEVERFLGYLGQLPFDVITPALSELLHRPDLNARTKLTIVHRLTELATAEVRGFLESYVASLPPEDQSEVRRAAQDAIPRIGQ